MSSHPATYSIPERYRKVENIHIVFWLLKDLSWAMLWRPLGLFMIIPTIGAAILITWQTRHIRSELFHNLAVDFWIIANAYWMIVEFIGLPDHYRYYAALPFGIGLCFIAIYYGFISPAENKQAKAVREALPAVATEESTPSQL